MLPSRCHRAAFSVPLWRNHGCPTLIPLLSYSSSCMTAYCPSLLSTTKCPCNSMLLRMYVSTNTNASGSHHPNGSASERERTKHFVFARSFALLTVRQRRRQLKISTLNITLTVTQVKNSPALDDGVLVFSSRRGSAWTAANLSKASFNLSVNSSRPTNQRITMEKGRHDEPRLHPCDHVTIDVLPRRVEDGRRRGVVTCGDNLSGGAKTNTRSDGRSRTEYLAHVKGALPRLYQPRESDPSDWLSYKTMGENIVRSLPRKVLCAADLETEVKYTLARALDPLIASLATSLQTNMRMLLHIVRTTTDFRD